MERCKYEQFVIKYFGLPEDVDFSKEITVNIADIVNMLAMFDNDRYSECIGVEFMSDIRHILSQRENVEIIVIGERSQNELPQQLIQKNIEPLIIKNYHKMSEIPFFPKQKHLPKGHERPYKFHR